MKTITYVKSRQLPLYLFLIFFCYLFIFQYILESYIDEILVAVLIIALSIGNIKLSKMKTYMIPISVMFVIILIWSTSLHQSFIYYFIMVEVILLIRPNYDNIALILKVVKRTALINALFVFISWLTPEMMFSYAKLAFPDNIANAYIVSLQNGYYAGINNQVAFTAVYLVLGIMVFTYDPRENKKDRRILRFVILSLLWFALVLTNKRSHLLYIFVAMLSVYYAGGIKSKKIDRALKIIFAIFVMLVIFYFIANLFPTIPLFSRMLSIFTILTGNTDLNSIFSGRIAIYSQVIDIFKKNKTFGIGWQNFGTYSRYTSITGGVNQGHNVFLQLLCETGIVGFCIFMIINLYYFISNFKINNMIISKKDYQRDKIDMYRKCAIGFMVFYYIFWFSGNPIYDFTFVYTWVISIMISQSLKQIQYDLSRREMIR